MVNQVLFNENELKELSDKTLYFMYKEYYNQAFVDYIDGNKAYIKHKNIANTIKKEILSRCDKEISWSVFIFLSKGNGTTKPY